MEKVTQTNLHSNTILWLKSSKGLIMVEVTMPSEEGTDKAHKLKKSIYQDLADTC